MITIRTDLLEYITGIKRLGFDMEQKSTEFASPERAGKDELLASVRVVANHPLLQTVLDTFGSYLMVLNKDRQIIAVNNWLLRKLGCDTPEKTIGLRPGEAFNCVNVDKNPCGCGTGKACSVCGTVIAILSSQETGKQCIEECTLTVSDKERKETLEFEVVATPFPVNGEHLTVVSLRDISDEKHKDRMERIFFHDIMNTISGISGWSKALMETLDPETAEIPQRIVELTNRLKQEVEYHQTLLKAEKGELTLQSEEIDVPGMFTEIKIFFDKHPVAENKTLTIAGCESDIAFRSDRTLLVRVLINMVKNAFEATKEGGEVLIMCCTDNDQIKFSVWNNAFIPPEIALRIFQRSFSTKASNGRGLGTYSMKLLGEEYLGGAIVFTSKQGEGTTFAIRIPLEGPDGTAMG